MNDDVTIHQALVQAKQAAIKHHIKPVYAALGRRKMEALRDYLRMLHAMNGTVNVGKPTDHYLEFEGLKICFGETPGIIISEFPPIT